MNQRIMDLDKYLIWESETRPSPQKRQRQSTHTDSKTASAYLPPGFLWGKLSVWAQWRHQFEESLPPSMMFLFYSCFSELGILKSMYTF